MSSVVISGENDDYGVVIVVVVIVEQTVDQIMEIQPQIHSLWVRFSLIMGTI